MSKGKGLQPRSARTRGERHELRRRIWDFHHLGPQRGCVKGVLRRANGRGQDRWFRPKRDEDHDEHDANRRSVEEGTQQRSPNAMKNRLPKYGSSRRAALDFLAKLSFEQIDEGIDSRRPGPGEAARVSTQGEPPVRHPVR